MGIVSKGLDYIGGKAMIIGLLGYARVGKDEVANVLHEEYGFEKYAYANHLKAQLEVLNPVVGTYGGELVRLNTVLGIYGWDGAKDTIHGEEIRRLMQVFGNDVAKSIAGKRVWIDRVINDIVRSPAAHHVVSDVRFIDELEWMRVRKMGNAKSAVFIRITRPDTGPVNGHVSESELAGVKVDHTVHNDGTLKELKSKIDDIMDTYREKL